MLGAKQCTRVKNMPRGPKGEHRPADVIGNTVHVMRSTPEEGKDPAGVALGRKGGKARAERMSAKRRKGIARTAAKARWKYAGRADRSAGRGPGRIGGIPKDSRSRHPRRDLFGDQRAYGALGLK